MGPSPRLQRDDNPVAKLKRYIVQGTLDAEQFHALATQCIALGNQTLAEKAIAAEKACLDNVSALERELKERF